MTDVSIGITPAKLIFSHARPEMVSRVLTLQN
jgi:hypothetical protein